MTLDEKEQIQNRWRRRGEGGIKNKNKHVNDSTALIPALRIKSLYLKWVAESAVRARSRHGVICGCETANIAHHGRRKRT